MQRNPIETISSLDRPSQVTDSLPLRVLRAFLDDPAHAIVAPQALAALAHVAPAECLEIICDSSASLDGLIRPDELSTAIFVALQSAAVDGVSRRSFARSILHRCGSKLSARTLAALFAAAAPGSCPENEAAARGALERFPNDARLLRSIVDAVKDGCPDRLLDELLARLGRADNSPATVSFVKRLRPANLSAALIPVRVAFVSSFTIDHLEPFVDLAAREIGLRPEVYIAPFNSWASDIIDETSGLRRFNPEIVFLSVALDDLLPELAFPLDAERLSAAGAVALDRVLAVAERFTTWAGGKPLVVHGFHSAFRSSSELPTAASRGAWLAELNAKLEAGLHALPACYMLDVEAATTLAGGRFTDDPKLRHIASMRLPPDSLKGIADAYVRFLSPLKGQTRKCVVLDLDNTLWGGVVGEDSKEGIRLGNSSPGSEFVEFQHFLASLPQRGIMLALNSKNNPAEALDAIRTHESMVLKESAFSAIRINWKPKHENMVSIAQELNIGVDSLVFVDDNPDERELMRQFLPEVLTVDMPKDPAKYRSALERLPALQTLAITAEDRSRAEQYAIEKLRVGARAEAASIEEYLASLRIETHIDEASRQKFLRVAQLFSKTNQFNVTTRRYDAAAVERFALDSSYRLYTLESRDRFGDHGLVAVALVSVTSRIWQIDSFVMSCRVIGYGIESALLAHIVDQAAALKATEVIGQFIETKKNAPAKDLYERHGFAPVASDDGRQLWRRSTSSPLPFPAWIAVRRHDA